MNNNERTRSVPGNGSSYSTAGGWLTGDTCEFGPGWPIEDLRIRLAWIEVVDGGLAAIHFSCA